MGETAEDTRRDAEEQRIARLDAKSERSRESVPEEDRDWLDSVVGMFSGNLKLDISAHIHEDV